MRYHRWLRAIQEHPIAICSWVDAEGQILRHEGGGLAAFPSPPSGSWVGTYMEPGILYEMLELALQGESHVYSVTWPDHSGHEHSFIGASAPWRGGDGQPIGCFFSALLMPDGATFGGLRV